MAIEYLHSLKLIHGDIKGVNVLVSPDEEALLCDFGLAKYFDDTQTSASIHGQGSSRWQSPEILMGGPRSFAGDVWSFGMTIYQVNGFSYVAHLAHPKSDTKWQPSIP
jgi:serine/threonine protein kinase